MLYDAAGLPATAETEIVYRTSYQPERYWRAIERRRWRGLTSFWAIRLGGRALELRMILPARVRGS